MFLNKGCFSTTAALQQQLFFIQDCYSTTAARNHGNSQPGTGPEATAGTLLTPNKYAAVTQACHSAEISAQQPCVEPPSVLSISQAASTG